MDDETAYHIHQVWNWLYNHVASVYLLSGLFVTGLFWAARQYFATRAAVETLREQNAQEHIKITEQNAEAHREITQLINDKHEKIMHTMLDLHGRDRDG